MNKPDLDIITSPQAERMRTMVTSGFYDRSRIGLWLYEAIGREYDEMAGWADTVHLEAFPQTCTWSIGIWEWIYGIEPDDALPMDFRRGRILSKRLQQPPINPARIEAILSALVGVPVEITEGVSPYTFKVTVDEAGMPATNLSQMYRLLREIKPSHLSVGYDYRQHVVFLNRNAFVYKSFGIKLRAKNRTAYLTGAGVLLNGQRRLDGSWKLDTSRLGLPFVDFGVKVDVHSSSDITPHALDIGVLALQNRFGVAANTQYGITANNQNEFSQADVKVSVSAANAYGFTGKVAKDNRWPLDGAVGLNGARSFSYYIEEEV